MSDDPEQVAGEGDIITVGAISNAEGIAIGRNARVEIRRYGDVIVRVDTLEDLPPTPGKEPYKGLTYYTEDDRDIFFGRERLSDDLAARLETTAFLLVAGASGSGKSSLLRAGVIPRLRQRNWLIRVLTPSADPLRRLAENLTPAGAARDAVDGLRDELAADPRTLRHAATHDPLWNAAQRQLVQEGRLHNYLRMLWGKKILEWSPTPQSALATMIELNNKYAVDGRNPNSYSGIFWVLGRYDRPWGPERPIYGKIRYMTSENTARKVAVKEYLERHGPATSRWLWGDDE